MNRELVAKTWLFSGLRDIYFAFDNDDDTFSENILFSEIMGSEKIIKAVILFHLHDEYEGKSRIEAKNKINDLAKNFGHDFKRMLKELSRLGVKQIDEIKKNDFDGYLGRDLVRAVYAGYMETRYPVPRSISDTFPIKGTKLKHDPLWSSGITKFIYAISNACFEALAPNIDLEELRNRFNQSYGHKESFRRFNNRFWTHRLH